MAVSAPKEAVYYYECSNGGFRLLYFIPTDELERLRKEGEISQQILEDYPDGVDLGCTVPDFEEFQHLYHYRPRFEPDALRRAFFAIFSATRDWETFQGSGFIPASDLERLVRTVEDNLGKEQIVLEEVPQLPDEPTLDQRRQRMNLRQVQQKQVISYLEAMKVEGIDPQQTLRHQRFSPIQMQEGERAEEVFSKLHLKRKRQ